MRIPVLPARPALPAFAGGKPKARLSVGDELLTFLQRATRPRRAKLGELEPGIGTVSACPDGGFRIAWQEGDYRTRVFADGTAICETLPTGGQKARRFEVTQANFDQRIEAALARHYALLRPRWRGITLY